MKLAEALMLRADQNRKLKELRSRIENTARYVEGEEPLEDVQELVTQARTLILHQAALIASINRTNATTHIAEGSAMTLTEALAKRDRLSAEISLLNEVAKAASPSHGLFDRRRRATELAEKTDLPVVSLRAEADQLSREHRELDTQIQQLNWVTDLQ